MLAYVGGIPYKATAPLLGAAVEDAFAVVGEEHHDSILVLEQPQYGVGYVVIIAESVVIVCQDLPLVVRQVGASVVCRLEQGGVLREALPEVDMYAEKMEYVQLWGDRVRRLPEVAGQSEVELVGTVVAVVEHLTAQSGMVDEQVFLEGTAATAVHDELVAVEGRAVACESEQLWKERVGGPAALHADAVGGQHILERFAGDIPGTYGICEYGQFTFLHSGYQKRGGRLVISVERGVMAVAAFADDEHDAGRGVAAGGDFGLLEGTEKRLSGAVEPAVLREGVGKAIGRNVVFRLR